MCRPARIQFVAKLLDPVPDILNLRSVTLLMGFQRNSKESKLAAVQPERGIIMYHVGCCVFFTLLVTAFNEAQRNSRGTGDTDRWCWWREVIHVDLVSLFTFRGVELGTG